MNSSGFKAKGTIILTFKALVSDRLDEDFFWDLWRQCGYEKGIILPSSWYDQDRYATMISKAAKELRMSERELIIDLALLSIKRDLNGVYKFLMRKGGPKILLGAIPKLAKAYSDFSRMELVHSEEGCVKIKIEANDQHYLFARWSCEGAAVSIVDLCNRNMVHFIEIECSEFESDGTLRRVGIYEIKYN